MRYMGGKARLGPRIAEALAPAAATRLRIVEPFMGGGNATEHLLDLAPAYYAADGNPDIAALWIAAQRGWRPPWWLANKYSYTRARATREVSAWRGYIGACGYGGAWMGSYAETYNHGRSGRVVMPAREAAIAVNRLADRLDPARVTIAAHTYEHTRVLPTDLVYCDPPYAGTTGYGGAGVFDHARFWATCHEWVKLGALVAVSEYTAPPPWQPIATFNHTANLPNFNVAAAASTIEHVYAHHTQYAEFTSHLLW